MEEANELLEIWLDFANIMKDLARIRNDRFIIHPLIKTNWFGKYWHLKFWELKAKLDDYKKQIKYLKKQLKEVNYDKRKY